MAMTEEQKRVMADGRAKRWQPDRRARAAVKELTMVLPKLSDEDRAKIAGDLGPLTAAYRR